MDFWHSSLTALLEAVSSVFSSRPVDSSPLLLYHASKLLNYLKTIFLHLFAGVGLRLDWQPFQHCDWRWLPIDFDI
jgi:hypothetical protein